MHSGQMSPKGCRVISNEKTRGAASASELERDKDDSHTDENVALYVFPPDRGISELRVNEGW